MAAEGTVWCLLGLNNRKATAVIMKFRKKPVMIEAIRWDGTNLGELQAWGCPATPLPSAGDGLIIGTCEDGPNHEAVHVADMGDWIIRGIKGEFYPCKPDIFAATYEPVDMPAK